MMLWLAFALMTAAAIFAVLWPLGRRGAARPAGSDVVVYRDQLDEIARDRAAGLLGATPDREAALGEAITAAQNGIVTAEARAAFARAVAREPKHDVARYYLGLAAEQDGKREEAAAA